MLNASSFLVFYRWKPIETLFYTVISVIKFDTNTSVQPNTTEAPTFRQWEVERLNFLCTVIVPHLFAVIILLAFLANTLVICVIIGKKKLRTPLNVFFINLAISDIILVVFGLPFIAYRYAAETWLLRRSHLSHAPLRNNDNDFRQRLHNGCSVCVSLSLADKQRHRWQHGRMSPQHLLRGCHLDYYATAQCSHSLAIQRKNKNDALSRNL